MSKCSENTLAMESIEEQKKIERRHALAEWLKYGCGLQYTSFQAMPHDASFRRYFRIYTHSDTFVVMDAKPPEENCRPFVAIANMLRERGLKTPEIFSADMERGFLLLTDFGDLTYLKALDPQNADLLYSRALDALAVLQGCRHADGIQIPPFTREVMWQEWALHKEWFLEKLLGLSLPADKESELDQCMAWVIDSAATQPQVLMHRDYHSANLMALPNQQVGLLDFQDAFMGPVTYDLVSLLRDCYIDWPDTEVRKWVLGYLVRLQNLGVLTQVSHPEFLRWFDWMGIQRHLKALLTFARKYVRDGQSNYLKHIPRTLGYLLKETQQYDEFKVLHQYLCEKVVPSVKRAEIVCEQ